MGDLGEYDFTKVSEEIAKNEGIKDATLKLQYKTNKGDGYVGIINAFKMIGNNKSLDLIFKYSPRSSKLHEKIPIHATFVNENNFYTVVYPQLKKFQENHGVKERFDQMAKCYAAIYDKTQELIVLENLRTAGFDMWNRKTLMNGGHIEYVFATFAKFHGISFAMKKLEPELFRKIQKDAYSGVNLFKEMFITMGMDAQLSKLFLELTSLFDPVHEKNLHDSFSTFAKNVVDILLKILNTEDEFSVISQGDCWCNNMMFKYDAENSESRAKPSDMRLLDFQISKIGPLVLDLSYFFYASASKEALDNLDNHLKSYHKNLGCYLKQYGIDVNEVYTFENFKAEWKKYCKFGLTMAIFLRKIMLADADEVPDMSEAAEKDGDMLNEFSFESKHENEYKRQIKELVAHFVQREFI